MAEKIRELTIDKDYNQRMCNDWFPESEDEGKNDIGGSLNDLWYNSEPKKLKDYTVENK